MLVIIGLLVGGVLVGRDLIISAQHRGQMTQLEKISLGVQAFRLKYYCLPGDCANATNYFSAGAQPEQVTNGDGDWMLEHETCNGRLGRFIWTSWAHGDDWRLAFDHLAAAQMVPAGQYDETSSASNTPGIGYPKCSYIGGGQSSNSAAQTAGQVCGVGLAYEFNRHYFRLGLFGNATAKTSGLFGLGYLPGDAFSIDDKFDDGLPLGGLIQVGPRDYSCYHAASGVTGGTDGTDTTRDATYGVLTTCTNAGGTAYNTAETIYRYCSMKISASF